MCTSIFLNAQNEEDIIREFIPCKNLTKLEQTFSIRCKYKLLLFI